jgi:hypothetical protein
VVQRVESGHGTQRKMMPVPTLGVFEAYPIGFIFDVDASGDRYLACQNWRPLAPGKGIETRVTSLDTKTLYL